MSTPRLNPYPGPRSFKRGEKLYGREREKWDLLDQLIAERIVLLYSPSGAGKTSLVQAALIPDLDHEGFRVLPTMRVSLLPGAGQASTANPHILSLLLSLEEPLQPGERTPLETLTGLSLLQYLDLHPPPPGRLSQRDVLIFDQFEEILTLQPTDLAGKQAFFEQVGEALANRNRWALFVMREEFIAGLDPYLLPIPTRFDNSHRFRLDLLGPEAAREAMQGPARDSGVEFTDAAAEKLVNDLRLTRVQLPDGSTATLPGTHVEAVQLQVVCRRLWDRMPAGDSRIDEEDVRDVGTVDTALGAYYAETVSQIAEATAVDERKIRDWVDRQLITEQGIRGQVLKGKQRSPEGEEGLDNAAVEQLVDSHLVRAEQRRNTTWFELSHDRLIEPLRADNAAWREQHLSLLQRRADLWQRGGRAEHLLLEGQQLISAELWAAEHLDVLEPHEQEFLDASREARERSLSPVERAAARWASEGRPENLLPQGQNLLDAQQWAEAHVGELKPHEREYLAAAEQRAVVAGREKRQSQRIRVLAWAASILAVCALLFAMFAWSRQTNASNAQATAEAEATRAFAAAEDAKTSAALAATREAEAEAAWEMASREARRAKANELAAEVQNEIGKGLPDPSRALLLAQEAVRATWDQDGEVQDKAYRTLLSVVAQAPPWQMNLPAGGPGSPIYWASFSPDGARIVTAGDGATATVWDAASGQPMLSLPGHTDQIFSAAYSPDGSRIVSASKDKTARVWDATTGAALLTLDGHGDWVTSASFSPDNDGIVTTSSDGTTRIWDSTTGRELLVLSDQGGIVNAAAFSPDGKQIVTAGADGKARVWDAATGADPLKLEGHAGAVNAAAFSPDGTQIVTAGDDNTARIWDTATGKELQTLRGHTEPVKAADFNSDGTQVVTASTDNTARVWDATTGNVMLTLTGHTGPVNAASYSSDGRRIVTVSADGTAKVWGVAPELATFMLPVDRFVASTAYSPDGKRIVTANADGTVSIWDTASRQRVQQLTGHTDSVNSAVFGPDAQTILTASNDQTARLWDAQTGQELRQFVGHTGPVSWAAFSQDGGRIVTASGDNTARIWDAATGQELRRLEGHTDSVKSASFSPDGKNVVTASSDRTARLWDAATGRELRRLEGHTEVNWAAFSPDGKSTVTASTDGTARTWDVATGRSPLTLTGHADAVNAAHYSPDGRRIVTASSDGTVRVWDARSGETTLTLDGQSGAVWSASFSPDQTSIITVSLDGSVRLWPLTGDALIRRAQALVQRYDPALTEVEKEQYGIK